MILKRISIWGLVVLTCACAATQKPPTAPESADTTKTEDIAKAVPLELEGTDEIVLEDEEEEVIQPKKWANYSEDLSSVRPVFEVKVLDDTLYLGTDTSEVNAVDMEVTDQIDSVMRRVQNYNLTHPPKLKGYRIQVYSGGNQTEAYQAVAVAKEVLGKRIYNKVQWSAPVFRSRVGCFISRLEAYKAFRLLEKDFPNALVVPDNEIEPDCVK